MASVVPPKVDKDLIRGEDVGGTGWEPQTQPGLARHDGGGGDTFGGKILGEKNGEVEYKIAFPLSQKLRKKKKVYTHTPNIYNLQGKDDTIC